MLALYDTCEVRIPARYPLATEHRSRESLCCADDSESRDLFSDSVFGSASARSRVAIADNGSARAASPLSLEIRCGERLSICALEGHSARVSRLLDGREFIIPLEELRAW